MTIEEAIEILEPAYILDEDLFNISNKQYATRFCPVCGKPLIEEAWAELERRIGGES